MIANSFFIFTNITTCIVLQINDIYKENGGTFSFENKHLDAFSYSGPIESGIDAINDAYI